MKQIQNFYKQQEEIYRLTEAFWAAKMLQEKIRVNLYLPKVIVKLIDALAKNTSRGKVITSLIIKEVKNKKKLPYGMFSPLEISEKEIDEMAGELDKTFYELI